ncbi:MAG TPA: CrcB family protein, partial [Acidimicrobiales bacterium]|nr:CrcB family protein [Acidimicrobiales bacterium]
NVSGCLVLGVLTGFGLYHGLDATTRTVLGTGGLGAYTTFSTFTFETVRLAEAGALDQALRNVAATAVVGLGAAGAGLAVAAAL